MSDTNIVVDSNTVNSAVDKVSSMIDQLAQQLGIAAEHFYPIFVQQQFYTGVTGAIIAGITAS